MNVLQRSRVWLSRREILTLFMMLILSPWILQACFQRSQPRITHSLGSSTQPVDVLWLNQEIFTQTTKDGSGVIYAMPIARDSLIAIDIRNGTAIWNIKLPLERGGGARGLLTNQNTVFVTTSMFTDAYEITTGKLIWSTRLGDGHVSVIPQLDSNVLRVYYGNNLIELDPKTGKMLSAIPKGNTAWVSGNVILQISPTKQLIAVDKQSGELLWTNDRLFYIDEGQDPLYVDNENLLVGFVRGICALNLQTGEYSWCHPEIDISSMTLDYQSQQGYAIRDDMTLLTIDLQTGNILGETSFLSSEPIDERIGFLSSITFSDGVVVVSFSDSGQTFGLQFNDLK